LCLKIVEISHVKKINRVRSMDQKEREQLLPFLVSALKWI
jgi:hypothetical protein